MSTTLRAAMATSLLILYAANTNAQSTCSVALKTMTNIGCFSSGGLLVDQGSYTYQTAGYCQCQCATLNKAVMATYKGSDCYCGDLLPPTDSVASNSSCNSPCQGYDTADCGGDGFWSVALTGIESDVGNAPAGSGSTSSSPTSQIPTVTQTAAPSVITKAGQTIVVTASSAAKNTPSSGGSGGGSSKAGIAAGVVVGVVAIAAIIGGIYFFLRQRKRRAVEEEFRRNAAVNSFVSGKAKSEVSSTNDQRLDPNITAFHRRQSIGSIADERDFSRRILQVSTLAPGAISIPHTRIMGI
jgi:cell wall integrity and stress response component